ncbi:flavodoxin [Aquimarina hainanensis]|uniref:Flavodoxin n=1 Tax=Aquimarina hainanensis TaxID=1578017 RepID=A0ABW5N486_9FLAO|nr:flavodoxin [Aquimarina sp. TRL1]QKX05928.1 flavodoxin [Aquimarina sp. TRL1]
MGKNNGILLVYGSDTGMTEEITHVIVDECDFNEINVVEVANVTKDDFAAYDYFILGLPTWYDGELQSDWEEYFEEFKTIDFTGKTVAVFGLGDQYGYPQYFVDGIGIIAKEVLRNGGEIVGHWSTEFYDFDESKALYNEELFYGLALDEDNQTDLSSERITDWLEILRKHFN